MFPTIESCEPESDIQLQRKLKSALKKIKQLNAQVLALKSHIENIFNEDQLLFIHHGSVKGFSWSEDTLQKALRLYMACGTSGYQEMLKQKLPLPCIRTIQRHIQSMKFKPGVLHDVLKNVEAKVKPI